MAEYNSIVVSEAVIPPSVVPFPLREESDELSVVQTVLAAYVLVLI